MSRAVTQRRNTIRQILLSDGGVRAEKLASRFDVSVETIRRDIRILSMDGYIQKKYGGAEIAPTIQKAIMSISPVQKRMLTRCDEKKAIAARAAKMVEPGMRVFLDAGSTVYAMIDYLHDIDDLTIITNGLDAAKTCSESEDFSNVVMLGGQLLRNSMSMVGPSAVEQLRNLNIDMAFMGAPGVSTRGYCISGNQQEAELKAAAVKCANRSVLLADSSKWNIEELYIFAKFSQLDALISSADIDEAILRELEGKDLRLLLA